MTSVSFRTYFFLFVLALIPPIIIAQFQPAPGYLDSDYYFAGGIQLFEGKGFTEPYMWNYLDGSRSLPHPSHAYWQPLASIVAALGMWLTGQATYASARIFFILLAAFVSPLTAYLSFRITSDKSTALISGLLAIFCVYNAPFLGATDNFGLFMLFGCLYFIHLTRLMEEKNSIHHWVVLGLLSGLMTLARTDGLLWLGLTFLVALWWSPRTKVSSFIVYLIRAILLALFGFLLVMSPWYYRNWQVYGSVMAPGGSRALWLDNYNQTFIYPPEKLSFDSFIAIGWQEILLDRLKAFGSNLASAFAAHGGILLFPFIVIGAINHRNDYRVRLAIVGWSILFVVMTFLFPFAGARGAFFHAGAAFQPIWWILAPLGLDALLASLRKRNWGNDQARVMFRGGLVMIAFILTAFVVNLRLFGLGWSEGEHIYPSVEQFLVEKGIRSDDVVIVKNPPGYYLETRRSGVPIPYGDEETILEVASQFHASYLILEADAVTELLQDLNEKPNSNPQFIYLGEINDAKIFRIESN